jgi:hypothetical protein
MDISAINDPTTRFVAVMHEREAIRLRREQGLPLPWTSDPILQTYRFCNIRREDDAATQWISNHWREPHQDDPDLWFAMVIARFVNWPDTLAELGYPVPWGPEHFLAVMNARKARGEVCFGPAYNISNGGSTTPKAEHLVQQVFGPLWQRHKRLRPIEDDSLLSFYGRLKQMPGFASFMAAQVVADLKYVSPLKHARDWATFAAPGPGSKRGLNRVLGRKVDAPWRSDTAWHDQLILFRTKMRRCLPKLTSIFHTLKIPRTCIANLINTTERVKADDSSAAYSGHISHATSNVTMVMKAIAELSDINGNIADSLIAMVLSKVQSVDQRMRLECGVGFRQLRKCHRTRPGHCVLTHRNKSTAIRSPRRRAQAASAAPRCRRPWPFTC